MRPKATVTSFEMGSESVTWSMRSRLSPIRSYGVLTRDLTLSQNLFRDVVVVGVHFDFQVSSNLSKSKTSLLRFLKENDIESPSAVGAMKLKKWS
jgi:hypothetical protein